MNHQDQFLVRVTARNAKTRLFRERVCARGIRADDSKTAIGIIYSELACDRCGRAPCPGVVVQKVPT
jgi:hypothetical protein